MRRLACCHREKGISLDLDEQERIMKYDGLESCILNNHSYDDESSTSRADGCATDSLDENDSVCSSSKDASGSFSSSCLVSKEGEHGPDEEEVSSSLKQFYVKEKESNAVQFTDVETMKEKFSKLLLGEDVTGGCKGLTTALALSNAIVNLAASVFGELWKLEPLSEEKKIRWRREMNWFISPTNYMVELVPARQSGTNGRSLEIMTPKARADIHVNLPALQKLDSMLMETLDSMVKTEFWYAEGGSRAEGRNRSDRPSKRWWLPSPQVPTNGLSASGRKKLLYHGKLVHQVFKAAKVINSNVLLEMPVPTAIRNALPKSGKENLGVELYRILSAEVNSMDKTIASLGFKSEHSVLQTMNQLETAILAWKETITDQTHGKSPVRNSWSFMRDSVFELDRIEALLDRAQALLQVLHIRYPNLPHTFLDVTKVKYNKDVGHSILEAYSRVLANLAFSILSRIRDILEEDDLSNPNSPVVSCCFSSVNLAGSYETPATSGRVRNSLIDQMKKTDGRHCDLNVKEIPKVEISDYETKIRSLTTTPLRSKVWCIGVPLTNCP